MRYKRFLETKIFKIDEYYQFKLLIDDLYGINKYKFSHIAIIERSFIYSGKSIFSPIFKAKNISIIDYQFKSMQKSRKGLQAEWIEKENYNFLCGNFL